MAPTRSKQHALIIAAHPMTESLTHSIVRQVREALIDADISVEVADLHAEGFISAMTPADVSYYRGEGDLPEDVVREQRRFDKADMVYFVFPIYWWTVPALLKGWFERVFTSGWAYDYQGDGKASGRLKPVPVHLIITITTGEESFCRHGSKAAFQTQVVDGILGYCGLKDVRTSMLWGADYVDDENFASFMAEITATLPHRSVAKQSHSECI
ncbi:NAD(P)H-dependent oxidoreductase [Pseudomonas sp. S07E 245]|uniref:NAD(P)H-dependent oxidoreductase n=1 Tax=Pseudomonas sp. S07E 245 TaxID=2866278 RepID=UPI001C738C13|nr:NAD(P)H-dependent oxidoreductase [Pseudomonas sp. S07E 245]QYX54663.1 NAD(P)H-dependent oxidoreductase [Pseudomonas sp. S07E 245]